MEHKKENGREGARVKREEAWGFLGIAPMEIHKNQGVWSGPFCLEFFHAEAKNRDSHFWQDKLIQKTRIAKFEIGRFIAQHAVAVD